MPITTAPQFFVGVVTSSDAASYVVTVETHGQTLKSPMQAVPLASVFATTLGFRECSPYPIGAQVLCYYVDLSLCYIIGIIPQHDIKDIQWFARTALKTADGNFDAQNIQGYNADSTKKALYNQGRPTDVVEGEKVVMNDFGVLMGLFQSMACLKGSELSQVQCYLLDDLVRIISHNYEHFTAMGEFKVWHDGKAIMAELGATHLSQESMGSPMVTSDETSPVFEDDDSPRKNSPPGSDVADYIKFSEDERTKAVERLKLFMGRLSDFLHLFIVRPDPDAIRALAGELGGKHDTGMADVHVGLDGRISVRTVTGAAIEKTNWIMVPHRIRTPEDPEGDETDDITFDTKDPFEFDDSHKVRGNPSLYFLQMRDCNAYLQDFYNYKNFLKYKKDFALSGGPEKEEHKLDSIEEVDPTTPVNLNNYVLRRSGLYLMDNGGVMIKDAWGSAIVLEGGDIYLQAAKDLVAQPLRNYIAKAGQFVSITARKDIDMSSTDEGFRLKTKKVQHLYSHEQGIVLQSESESDAEPSPEDEAYTSFGGVLLKSKKGVYTYGEKIFDRAEKNALYKADKLMLESLDGGLKLKSKAGITATAKESLFLVSDETIGVISQKSLVLIGKNSLAVAGGSTAVGNEGQVVGMVPHPGSLPAILDGTVPVDTLAESIGKSVMDAENNLEYQKQMAPFDEDEAFTKIKFRFLKSDKYNLGGSDEDHIPMTIGQQDDETFGFLKLTEWAEQEVNSTLPFPGKDKFNTYFVTANVNNLQKIGQDVYSKDSESLQNKGGELTDQSLNSYKVIN